VDNLTYIAWLLKGPTKKNFPLSHFHGWSKIVKAPLVQSASFFLSVPTGH